MEITVTKWFHLAEGEGESSLFVRGGSEITTPLRVWHGKTGVNPRSKYLARIIESVRLSNTTCYCTFLIEGWKDPHSGAMVRIHANKTLAFQGYRRELSRTLNHLEKDIDALLDTIPQPPITEM